MQITGGKALRGCVRVSGAKTDVLSKLAATLLFGGAVSLVNVPGILDVRRMVSILQSVGARVSYQADRITVTAEDLVATPAAHLIQKLRHSFCVVGPLLARVGAAVVPTPGGCNIGKRPVDFHIDALRKMGVNVDEREEIIVFSLAGSWLRGAKIVLDDRFRSAGTTNHIMMTAALAGGDTQIINACMEPETVALGEMLRAGGVQIEGLRSKTVTIHGDSGRLLRAGQFRVIGDRQEAATFMLAAAVTGGDVRVEGFQPSDVGPILGALALAGVRQTVNGGGIHISAGRLRPVDISTGPFPKFPSDVQPLWTALMTQAEGRLTVRENIFESRVGHVDKLKLMGAVMRVLEDRRQIEITGRAKLRGGCELLASDIREGAALVIAALCTEGTTELHTSIMDRGYENLRGKLRSLGADVE